MNRLARNFADGVPSFGILSKSTGVMIDHLAKAGFDYVIIDMMFSDIDWREAFGLIRAAQARQVYAFLRVPSYPWSGPRPDPRLVVDCARALSIGADGVCASVRSKEEVAEIVKVAGDWHRGLPMTTSSEVTAFEQEVRERTWIMPLLETREAIADYEAILDIPGVSAVWPGLSDLAEQLGHPMEYEHPEVTSWVEKVVAKAHQRGIAVCANDGMAYVTPEAKAQRLVQLRRLGVDLLEFAPAEHLAYIGAVATINRIRQLLSDPV